VPILPIGITADDLTGAADTAAALARPGEPVPVSVDAAPRAVGGRAAFAVTTGSRACPPDQVYELVKASVRRLRAAGAQTIYKKVDSNLRGQVGAELAAVEQATGGPVLLAPAFPARGRTTIEGTVLVHGLPVAETEMARDPQAPVTHSHLLELLHSQRDDLPVALCPLSVVRAGAKAVRLTVPADGVLATDAETDADLDVIVEAAFSLHPLPALSGSAGLAAALARRLFGPPTRLAWSQKRSGPLLAVLASSSQTLTSQVEVAARANLSPISFPCQGLTWEDQPVPELQGAIGAAIGELAEGRDALVHASGPLPPVERPIELVVEHLAHLAFVVVKERRPRGLLVGGGSTAQAVLEALGTEAVEVDDEPLPGIAAGLAVGGELSRRPLVLKPGAAGDEQAIVQLVEYLGRRATRAEGRS